MVEKLSLIHISLFTTSSAGCKKQSSCAVMDQAQDFSSLHIKRIHPVVFGCIRISLFKQLAALAHPNRTLRSPFTGGMRKAALLRQSRLFQCILCRHANCSAGYGGRGNIIDNRTVLLLNIFKNTLSIFPHTVIVLKQFNSLYGSILNPQPQPYLHQTRLTSVSYTHLYPQRSRQVRRCW